MNTIVSIKDRFITSEIFAIYSDCMYMPTWEKFKQRATAFVDNKDIIIFGFYEDEHILGIIVVDIQSKSAEIKGIAVDSNYRCHGIGQQLVNHAYNKLNLSVLIAETDDDAVGFYKTCGFHTEEFARKGENGEYKRHKCVFNKIIN